MTAAVGILVALEAQGFVLAPEGDRIKITPAGWLTAELRALIRTHKAELLAALDPASRTAATLDGATDPPPDVSPWDLPPDLFELWEERTCIAHYDGNLRWKEAEALALADVLGVAGADAAQGDGNHHDAEAAPVRGSLFADGTGPYGRGL